eukprot:TRINITY_DN38320_c0_g1_i1.p1 TRINITY_DN38320_c0_g1~~TRINITY_DN38320_c0_g1_i1.p1  ORF type:complete len:408 (-),score=122.48 TRINITY_DN38320_c0_g1_i1:51-1274(-)
MATRLRQHAAKKATAEESFPKLDLGDDVAMEAKRCSEVLEEKLPELREAEAALEAAAARRRSLDVEAAAEASEAYAFECELAALERHGEASAQLVTALQAVTEQAEDRAESLVRCTASGQELLAAGAESVLAHETAARQAARGCEELELELSEMESKAEASALALAEGSRPQQASSSRAEGAAAAALPRPVASSSSSPGLRGGGGGASCSLAASSSAQAMPAAAAKPVARVAAPASTVVSLAPAEVAKSVSRGRCSFGGAAAAAAAVTTAPSSSCAAAPSAPSSSSSAGPPRSLAAMARTPPAGSAMVAEARLLTGSSRGPAAVYYEPARGDAVDELLAEHIESSCPAVPFYRLSAGVYLFGTLKVTCRRAPTGRLVFRVGGGYCSFESLLQQYGPSELAKQPSVGP